MPGLLYAYALLAMLVVAFPWIRRAYADRGYRGNFIEEASGKNTEVVIHDLRHPESSLVYVIGNVTKREIGAPATNLILETFSHDLQKILSFSAPSPFLEKP